MHDKDTWLFEHFSPSEFTCKCKGLCQGEDVIDRTLVSGLDELRTALGVPLRVNSGQRCVEHNLRVGGSLESRHIFGLAADIRVPEGMTTQQLAEEAEKLEMFDIGGIGLYDTFVHLDVRGRRARWDNRS